MMTLKLIVRIAVIIILGLVSLPLIFGTRKKTTTSLSHKTTLPGYR
ncbi:hypothetical protein [Ileibacterium valens]|nr:hypothetical protein [Ileibacterium valens]